MFLHVSSYMLLHVMLLHVLILLCQSMSKIIDVCKINLQIEIQSVSQ